MSSITPNFSPPMTSGTSRSAQKDFDSKSAFSTSTFSSTASLLKGMFKDMIHVSNKKPRKEVNTKHKTDREWARKDNEPAQRLPYINGANSAGKISSLYNLSIIRGKLSDEDDINGSISI